jgi:alpha-galactosidase/6-phospho-beta-glucosidase family protein
MRQQHVVIVGGGGLVAGTTLCNLCKFGQHELERLVVHLFDPDRKALTDNADLLKCIVKRTERYYDLTTTEDLGEALAQADIVVIGAAPGARRQHGYFDNIANVLTTLQARDIPASAWILNYANPADLLTVCLATAFPHHRVAGVCTGPEEFKQNIATLLSVPPEDIYLEYCGTNHHGFVLRLEVSGRDVLPELRGRFQSFTPGQFRGLRSGDEHDLLANLDLFEASGVLTIPLGHDPYWHGNRQYVESAKLARWRPGREEFRRIVHSPLDADQVWRYLDSWGAYAIAAAILNLLGRRRDIVNLQLPNAGLIAEAPAQLYIEAPVYAGPRGFERIRFEIPWDIRLHVAHRSMYLHNLAFGLVERNSERMLRALIFKGQTRNFRYSLPELREILADTCHFRLPSKLLYEGVGEEWKTALRESEREFNFLFI